MADVVYAIRISDLEYTGLKIMDVKIGKTTNIDSRISQYKTGNRNIQLLDIWEPNSQKTLSTTEQGIQAIAEEYAYENPEGEKYVFLQNGYQKFTETVNKLLKNVTREELREEEEPTSEETETEDYTGKTPAVIKILGETHEVTSWTDCILVATSQLLSEVDDMEKLTEIKGRKRDYFVKEGRQSDLIAPKKIPNTDLYLESNFSANDVVRIVKKAMEKYGYESSEVEIFTQEDTN